MWNVHNEGVLSPLTCERLLGICGSNLNFKHCRYSHTRMIWTTFSYFKWFWRADVATAPRLRPAHFQMQPKTCALKLAQKRLFNPLWWDGGCDHQGDETRSFEFDYEGMSFWDYWWGILWWLVRIIRVEVSVGWRSLDSVIRAWPVVTCFMIRIVILILILCDFVPQINRRAIFRGLWCVY